MNPIRRLWESFLNLHSPALNRANEALRRAASNSCKVMADIDYHTRMLKFFDQQAGALDPNQDWWEFAAAKESAKEQHQMLVALQRHKEEALANFSACTERVQMIRQGETNV